MPAGATWDGADNLISRLQATIDAAKPTSREGQAVLRDEVQIIRDGHRDAVLAGRDRQGHEMPPLARSTIKQRRRRGISGNVPFITKGTASSVIRDLDVRVESQTDGRATIVLRLVGEAARWIKYHQDGAGRLPRRDPVGIRPETLMKMRERWARYADEIGRTLTGR